MKPRGGPEITVITPYNGSGTIGSLVRSLARQSLDSEKYELLIGCEAGAEPDLNNLGGLPFAVRIVAAPKAVGREFHTAARLRNAAIRQARGARLVFIDSDCVASPRCLERHAIADGQTALCGTKQEVVHSSRMPDDGDCVFEQLSAGTRPDERLTHQPQPGRCGCWAFWTCNASASTDLVMVAGLFDEHGFRCHDLDLAYRLKLGGACFRLDPECQVVHVEHGRSIWLTRARIAGLSWLAKKHPEAEAGAENLLAVFRNLFHNNLLQAEQRFTRLMASVPGVRAGLAWVTPCGYPLSSVLPALKGLETIVRRHEHGVQIFIRLAEQCWDYSVIVPDAKIAESPLFSLVVLPSDDEEGIVRTVESLLSQTCQSFELVLAASAETVGRLHGALNFCACGRLRTQFVPPKTVSAGVVERVLPLCRGEYAVFVKAGGWLRENLLAEIARGIQQARGGSVAEICRGCDWSMAELNGSEAAVAGEEGAISCEIRVYRVPHKPAEAVRHIVFRLSGQAANAGDPSTLACELRNPESHVGKPNVCGFTFDSGPHPILTHRVLDALDEVGMKGTFFLVGSQIRRSTDVVRRLVTGGHEVALQGYDYEDLSRCTYSAISSSIEKTIALLADVAGVMPKWFRPPFSRCSALVREVCIEKHLKPVGWHVSPGDWTGQHRNRTVSNVLSYGLRGAIVLFHDGCGDPWETAEAVRALGRIARADGTEGARLSDLESLILLPAL